MKRLVQFVARLYPAAWRRRYEAEFHVFLDDVTPDWRTVLDVLKGAVVMQLRTISLRKTVAVAGLVGLLFGLGIWLVMPNQYASVAMLRIQASRVPGDRASDQLAAHDFRELLPAVLSNKSLLEIIRKYNLYPGKESKLPLEEITAEMRKSIEIRPAGQGAVFVRFRYSNPVVAQRVTGDLISTIMNFQVKPGTTLWPPRFTLMVLDSPSLSPNAIAPNPLRLAAVGLFAGILVGLAAVMVRRVSGAKAISS